MAAFSLTAHINGLERRASAYSDGYGWVVELPSRQVAAGRFEAAVRLARDEIGLYLKDARRDQVWGLVVTVGRYSALYGEPNPAAGVVLTGPPADPNTTVARIRKRWRDGDSPISALENALQIVRELTGAALDAAA